MQTQGNITLLEKTSEISTWLKKQSVTRKITKLQVHHTGLPSYETWEKTDKKVFTNPYFGRANSLDSYAKKTWNSKSANGSYQAQHFVVFPDGKITTGRSLNSNPIGITGWNTGAICVEIYGNFDKGQDTMTSAQKKAVIALFGELCKRFDLTPSASTIRYHAWFTSGGTYLGDYKAGKSRKTCPGTAFFGGNTMSAFKKNFLPEIKKYINGETEKKDETKKEETTFKKYIARVTTENLNCRKGAGTSYDIIQQIHKGDVFTVVAESGNWVKSASGYWVSKSYIEFVRYV